MKMNVSRGPVHAFVCVGSGVADDVGRKKIPIWNGCFSIKSEDIMT